MRALKRQRRNWSNTEKIAILSEALDSSISNVARKYGILPSLLFGWRKQFQTSGPNQQKPIVDKVAVNGPTLNREYRKLAKIQAALSTKLKRDLANDAISAYNAGNTLISLYNGMSKLESLRNVMSDALENTDRPEIESQEKSPELERAAEQLLSIYAKEVYGKH